MTESILLALWVGTSIFFICREIKIKDSQRSHEYLLSELRYCLHRIQNEFRSQCQEHTKMFFLHYNERLNRIDSCSGGSVEEFLVRDLLDDIRDYQSTIDKIKQQHIDNVYDKVQEKFNRSSNIPEHLMKEYEQNIKDISDTFHNFGYLMWEQAIEKKQRRR